MEKQKIIDDEVKNSKWQVASSEYLLQVERGAGMTVLQPVKAEKATEGYGRPPIGK
jgi:hypothetical protein